MQLKTEYQNTPRKVITIELSKNETEIIRRLLTRAEFEDVFPSFFADIVHELTTFKEK